MSEPQNQASNLQKCATFAAFISVLRNGVIHDELSKSLQTMAEDLSNHAQEHNGKAVGSLKLEVKFKLEDGVFEIFAEHSTKLPKEKPARTVLWATPENFFTVANPKQVEMFGPREIRNGYGDNAAEVRVVGGDG